MTRIATLLLMLAICVAGCSTHTVAGARGTIIDAATGTPVQGARITRPSIRDDWGLQPQGLPAETVTSDSHGRFDLPPVRHRLLTVTYHIKEFGVAGSFIVSADGYVTHAVSGMATATNSWRVEAGEIVLKKP
jgi:hypothetical protein